MAPVRAKITLFGDSITRLSMDPDNSCWASYLANKLISYYVIDVKGFPGYTTKWALETATQLFTKDYLTDVEFFIMFFGHNDSWDPSGFPGVPPAQYRQNMETMIKLLLDNGLRREQIILVTPGWFNEPGWLKWQMDNLGSTTSKTFEHCRAYADACTDLANEIGCPIVDWWKVTINYQPLPELFTDGVHLSKKGATLLYQTIWSELKARIEVRHEKPVEKLICVEMPKQIAELLERSEQLMEEHKHHNNLVRYLIDLHQIR